jgi:hypothetical protein
MLPSVVLPSSTVARFGGFRHPAIIFFASSAAVKPTFAAAPCAAKRTVVAAAGTTAARRDSTGPSPNCRVATGLESRGIAAPVATERSVVATATAGAGAATMFVEECFLQLKGPPFSPTTTLPYRMRMLPFPSCGLSRPTKQRRRARLSLSAQQCTPGGPWTQTFRLLNSRSLSGAAPVGVGLACDAPAWRVGYPRLPTTWLQMMGIQQPAERQHTEKRFGNRGQSEQVYQTVTNTFAAPPRIDLGGCS